jgi:RNA polymerase sigma factor (sigma-70 family)
MGMGKEPMDRELIARADDPQAFALFYRRHVDRLVRFAAQRASDPADAADVAAAAFVVALRGAEQYDPRRGEPEAWLIGIAARLIANDRRRKVREALALAKLEGRALLQDDDVERLVQLMDNSALARATGEAVCHLPPQSREAVLLVGPEGLSEAEAAAVLGISAVAFRMRLSRARRRLARLVADEELSRARTGREGRSRLGRMSGRDRADVPMITEVTP